MRVWIDLTNSPHVLVMRPVIHASHNVQVFTTVGLSIALQALALVLWSADAQFVRTSYYAVVVRFGVCPFRALLSRRGHAPFPAPPHQTVRALLTHTAFRCSSL